jgi:molybdopterin molybdotransferase
MIDVKTARELIHYHSEATSKTEKVNLMDALGYVVSEDVVSKIDMPPFRQSAMDGYALCMNKSDTYNVVAEVTAGDNKNPSLFMGEAVRIFTGAPVPDTANTVVMQEKTSVKGDAIYLEVPIKINENIRPKGEQIKEGDVAIPKGTQIKGAHIGFLAGLGITHINVFKKPSIAIVVTGNELIPAGNRLGYGEIYESNGAMLKAVLEELGYKKTSVINVKDDFETTKTTLHKTINNYDVVIVTGGVSVGDYDFVGSALRDLGVDEIFYKVKQKPGKPIFFGKKNQKAIFGLPGNPAAALSCFYVYGYPHLKMREGALNNELQRISIPLSSDYTVKGNRAHFLKARIEGDSVGILSGQSSAMLRAFGYANALVFLPENAQELKKGEKVTAILLPNR